MSWGSLSPSEDFFPFQSWHITQPYWRSQHRKYCKVEGLNGAWQGLHTRFKTDWLTGLEGAMAGEARKSAETIQFPTDTRIILQGALWRDGFFRTRIIYVVFQTQQVTDLGEKTVHDYYLSCSPCCSSLAPGPILLQLLQHHWRVGSLSGVRDGQLGMGIPFSNLVLGGPSASLVVAKYKLLHVMLHLRGTNLWHEDGNLLKVKSTTMQ